jgi:predicted NAD/FAD-binding protein
MSLVRIAVIGGGISGLAAATYLDAAHEVTLFEAGSRVGGHTNTVEVFLDGVLHHVDTGFIVYNEPNYPEFTKLLARWEVATQPSEMSFSVSCARTGLEFSGTGPAGLFAQRTNLLRPDFWRLLREIVRFGRLGRKRLAGAGDGTGETVQEFLERGRFSDAFVDQYFIPLGAAIWSADPTTFTRFPAVALLRFLDNHGLLTLMKRPPWRTISGGSQRYVEAALRGLRAEVRVATPIRSIRRDVDGVVIAADSGPERFDAVVIAVHSDQALALLSDATPEEKEILGALGYQRNVAVLHSDAAMMPGRRAAWAAWNYHRGVGEAPLPTVTYWMNRLQRITSSRHLFVTLNRQDDIRPDLVHGRFVYEHPVYDVAALDAQQRWSEINGVHQTWFAGAWWGYGFHEDGVASARRVAAAIGGAT